MSERIHKCPNCGAVLRPGRFAREAVCEFCKSRVEIDEAAVAAERFRAAHARWNAPRENDGRASFALGERHWTEIGLVARGEIADVVLVESSRRPPERALLKVLRESADLPMLEA